MLGLTTPAGWRAGGQAADQLEQARQRSSENLAHALQASPAPRAPGSANGLTGRSCLVWSGCAVRRARPPRRLTREAAAGRTRSLWTCGLISSRPTSSFRARSPQVDAPRGARRPCSSSAPRAGRAPQRRAVAQSVALTVAPAPRAEERDCPAIVLQPGNLSAWSLKGEHLTDVSPLLGQLLAADQVDDALYNSLLIELSEVRPLRPHAWCSRSTITTMIMITTAMMLMLITKTVLWMRETSADRARGADVYPGVPSGGRVPRSAGRFGVRVLLARARHPHLYLRRQLHRARQPLPHPH